jgi:hypothetical protein
MFIQETKAKISASLKGKTYSEKTLIRMRMSEAKKGENPQFKIIFLVERSSSAHKKNLLKTDIFSVAPPPLLKK